MTILEKEDCKKINDVVDYILVHTQTSVGDIKEKFHLTKEEYDMISDLMMPAMRWYNRARHYEMGISKLIGRYKEQDRRAMDEMDTEDVDDEEHSEDEDLRAS